MSNGNEKNSSSSSPIDCDVGLGLKMQVQPSTETYSSCKRATMASSPYYNYQQLLSSGSNVNPTSFSSEAGDGGGSLLNQLAGGGGGDGIYEAFHNSGFRPTGGVYGKAPFTASQWQELERQKIIHKYMMANIPVPPELLLPISRTSLAPVSQSSTIGLELRFPSSGSDLEPWRCKRTDGKKWRCSRDVAPDQKYCERHAHKTKARSRKPVEVSPHKFTTNTKTTPQAPFQRATSLFPTMASATPYNDQTKSIEWFMKCGANNQQQWQQVFQTSSSSTTTLNFSRHNTDQQPQYQEKQADFNDPYIPDTNFSDSILELNANKTTRHFIDAWEKEGLDQIDGISHKGKKFSPSSSLTLSMSAGDGFDDEDFNFNGYLGIGMMSHSNNLDNVNPVSWMNNSAPGGPLGEALCLGNGKTTRGNSNLPSPRHGYSNSNSTNTNSSSCSKSSCEDGSHALNFIG